MKKNGILFLSILVALLLISNAFAVDYVKVKPLAQSIRTSVGMVKRGSQTQVPLITWGGDIATILGNGDSTDTKGGSVFAKQGLNLRLVRRDDFRKQVEEYMQGKTPYLRGTMGMINMASEVLSKDARTKPVVIYQLTWSAGGDCLVVKDSIKTAKNLKGKTIALQAYGPHVDYLTKILHDAGLSMKDVKIKWTPDLTGTDDSPAAALQNDSNIDAAFVIIPDGLMLTSNGAVGTGAEGSVRGARILLSTKTANRIISDVYAVRADYFKSNKNDVEAFVHGLILSQQALRELVSKKSSQASQYRKTMSAAAKVLLDSPQAIADTEGLYADCEFVGFSGNVKFFTNAKWPRNFNKLTAEIQRSFIGLGLLGKKASLPQANWKYDRLQAGLSNVRKTESPRFDTEQVAKMVAKKQAKGTLDEGELFSFEVFFRPNQNSFSADMYSEAFTKVVEQASTYGGAVITIEGHSDPLGYLKSKKAGKSQLILKRQKMAAKNLSMTRALAVRDSVMQYAAERGVALDESQFSTVGHGILQPRTGFCGSDPCPPKTKDEWLSNMRVVFRIIQVEAEADVFIPLN